MLALIIEIVKFLNSYQIISRRVLLYFMITVNLFDIIKIKLNYISYIPK